MAATGSEATDRKTPTQEAVQARPACPQCGSPHTQPFTHAGPVARVNMKCIDCGHLFKEQRPER